VSQRRDPRYFVMDGRARFDVDKALVLTCADTLKEAHEDIKDGNYGDAVIVDAQTWKIVYDPDPSIANDPMCQALWGKP